MHKHFAVAVLSVAGLVALAPAASADEFAFSFSGGGISSSGVFTISPTSTPGLDDITGITGTFTDTNDGISGAITGLYTPVSYTFPPATVAFTASGFSYDDTFWPGGNSPHNCSDYPFFGGEFDVYGVAFNVAGGYVGALWSDGNMPVRGLTYAAGDGNATTILDNPNAGGANQSEPVGVPVSLVTSSVPEPGSVLLMGLGLFVVFAVMSRRRTLPL
jgi:PEP-CTERM motif